MEFLLNRLTLIFTFVFSESNSAECYQFHMTYVGKFDPPGSVFFSLCFMRFCMQFYSTKVIAKLTIQANPHQFQKTFYSYRERCKLIS